MIVTMVVDLLSNPRLAEYDLSSIRRLSGGGAAMPDARGVVGVQRQRHCAAQGAEVELQWFVAGCHGDRSLVDREPPASACGGRQSVNKPK